MGSCLDPLRALPVGADRIRAATPFFGGGSCSFCLSVFKCSFQVGGVTFFTYLSWKAWLMLYIFGLSLLLFGSPPVTVTTAGTRSRAALRKRFRQKLAVGAWRDLHTHLLARLPYVNPTPAAEAKLLAQRAEFDRLWMEKRMAVQQRRLGEGEALAARARAGRGAAAGTGGNVGGGTAAASQATAFLEEVLGAGRGAAGDGEERTDDRGAEAPTTGGDDALNEEGEEAPAMTAASDSECEASTSARQIGRVAGGVRGQTNEGAPGDGAPTSGR